MKAVSRGPKNKKFNISRGSCISGVEFKIYKWKENP